MITCVPRANRYVNTFPATESVTEERCESVIGIVAVSSQPSAGWG